jgi:type I restriction enzyme R subunit
MTMNLGAALGVAIREYPMDTGPLFVDRQPVGVIEAKAGPTILTFIEDQTARYAVSQLKWRVEQKPLSFLFESTGQVTRLPMDGIRAPRLREVFQFFSTGNAQGMAD